MSRYFFALWPDNSIREAIINSSFQLSLTGRKTAKPNLHITLVFMGKLKSSQLSRVIQQAKRIACQKFQLYLNHTGYFKNNQIAWLGLKSIPDKLLQLHRQLIESTDHCSITINKQVYKPHMTVSRNSTISRTQLIKPIKWQVNDFVLIESIDTATGVIYQPVEYFTCY